MGKKLSELFLKNKKITFLGGEWIVEVQEWKQRDQLEGIRRSLGKR